MASKNTISEQGLCVNYINPLFWGERYARGLRAGIPTPRIGPHGFLRLVVLALRAPRKSLLNLLFNFLDYVHSCGYKNRWTLNGTRRSAR